MSDQVWTVWIGEYSDRRLISVCTTEERAKLVASNVKGEYFNEEADIRNMPLDRYVSELEQGLKPYFVRMEYDGKSDIEELDLSDSCRINMMPQLRLFRNDEFIEGTIWSKEPRGAIKVMNEHRVHMIASGSWE